MRLQIRRIVSLRSWALCTFGDGTKAGHSGCFKISVEGKWVLKIEWGRLRRGKMKAIAALFQRNEVARRFALLDAYDCMYWI